MKRSMSLQESRDSPLKKKKTKKNMCCNLIKDVANANLLGNLEKSRDIISAAKRDGKDLRFNFITAPVRFTFDNVRTRIEWENWIGKNTRY